jgi:uncharacterized membrane protein
MDSSRESEFDGRLTRLEAAVAAIERSVEALRRERRVDAAPPPVDTRRIPHQQRTYAPPPIAASPPWFASRDPEWWLSRVGVGFVVLAVLLLYVYAVDHGWITPSIRVALGAIVGGALMYAVRHVETQTVPVGGTDLGLRDLLLGAALAVWYISAYAAAVWYQLIPIWAARFIFFALTIVSTWIALDESKEIFALLAVAVGFFTPSILPAPAQSLAELALYTGAVTTVGLVIYLLRGWHTVLWITFFGFWITVASLLRPGSIPITILLALAATAFVRVPSLRRELLTLGSPRYTEPPENRFVSRLKEGMDDLSKAVGGGASRRDSLILWVLALSSPLLAVTLLRDTWPQYPHESWGALLLLLGAGAWIFVRGRVLDDEVRHVGLTAAALWIWTGLASLVPDPEAFAIVAVSSATIFWISERRIAGPRLISKLAIVWALLSIVVHELSVVPNLTLLHWRWVLSGIVVVVATASLVHRLMVEPDERNQALILGVAGHLTLLVVLWSALKPVWSPLVSTSYALLGAAMLILSRREAADRSLRYLGAATMVIVVARLFVVDLAEVETIWRVLLFLLIGGVFLFTANRMKIGVAREL